MSLPTPPRCPDPNRIPLEGMAIATQKQGLLPLHQSMMELDGRVARHQFEGIATDDNLSERDRLVRDLGDKPCIILCNHGLLTVGRSVAEAFYWMWYLNQACRIQLAAQSSGAELFIETHAGGFCLCRRGFQPPVLPLQI
ncbi:MULTISPECIES: class II aldolase/adducin family protein [Aphanizomenonaceae]|jgi:ribulose-5-phosphate 4-epimerase/fuculose-1-phosphate aldolase|uniref:Class II aldolase/adducin family protein n=1 Tax=Dolichospermum heterosporum TAC447 TaxID=747523 RepID=A0ABY5M3Z6_9CYAN|nr:MULTISPECIES: class II aldolase/adducin family protein [Aphanizomenonaceae]MBE9258028.1 class II aldolase/adducin family protein [Dolichospermum sp. LEGE 00246]UUO17491.1 class II aldolase/adducin family protein [Dolichospermum heterosporum TAC447]